jgi:hypothetical protein
VTARISPEELLAALKAAGFTEYHRVPAAYVRMAWPCDTPTGQIAVPSIVVPLDTLSVKYPQKVRAVLAMLTQTRAAGEAAGVVLSALGEP